ncbi:hypothetical protein LJC63_00135 [Ruminococcaceae bacterium OttesenSCG-928-L11]|nr:hypothetical protein [Ruminococcaceae bacterium OttesenSCG-928-L11]MDL2274137.1 hypothetical protein [Oscillospiraceae bacterium OttesenSCG-928-G22]
MDINFHYYAVKAIAVRAGFDEADAQYIASYSQFVDDFDSSFVVMLTDVPEYARYLALGSTWGLYWFMPVTTGFNSWFDMAQLITHSNQKWIVTPFHFIPELPLNNPALPANWRVAPADIDVPSLITDMLVESRTAFLTSTPATRSASLMRIGMLLHIFADTYAHQRFSGFQGWENHSYLRNVTNNIGNDDVTTLYDPDMYYTLPSVGHTNVNHAPDDSHVRFEMAQKANAGDDAYSLVYQRSNTEVFCDAAKEILKFLLSCNGLPMISDAEWALFVDSFRQGLLTPSKNEQFLNHHWHAQFDTITFAYNRENMMNSMLSTTGEVLEGEARNLAEVHGIDPLVFAVKSDAYYRYNVTADEIRRRVTGEPYHADARFDALKADMEAQTKINDESLGE